MRRIARSVPVAFALAVVGLLAFSATAVAQNAVTSPNSSILDVARPLYNAFAGGHYAYAAALLVVVVVALVKRYFGESVPFLHSDAGGSLMALVAAAASAAAAGLAAPDAHVTFALMKTALLVGVGAAGGYAVVKNLLIDPALKPLEAKAPPWLKPVFRVVTWVFDRPLSAPAPSSPAA